jgi:hypothetical protein
MRKWNQRSGSLVRGGSYNRLVCLGKGYSMKKRLRRLIFFCVIGLTLLCITVVGISTLSNLNLPTHSQVTDHLSDLEKARLAEAIHLRQTLGDAVWPGWGLLDIPIIVHNEEYAFLVGYSSPPDGWVKMPQHEPRGGPWEAVPDNTVESQVYYRQRLSNPDITPENFAVLVGGRWVATMQTKEYMEIDFYDEFREELPSMLRPIIPYRLVWGLLMDATDTYIGSLEHETFHALQGSAAPSRLSDAETANRIAEQYPWDDSILCEDWQYELDLLVRAVRAQSNEEAADLVRQFLARRDKRRATAGLSQDLVNYERQREWLEGLAKYAELSLGRLAGNTPGYTSLPALTADPGFREYTTREQYWSGQIDEVRRTTGHEGEIRFYYSGMAQAVLLDRLLPDWKARVFKLDVMLEDLLRLAIGQP